MTKIDVENLSATRVKLVVEIPFDELQDDLKNAYRSIASQVNVPGFRKGKVPARVIDQRFGRGTVLSEVANAVIPRLYERAVEENELVPLGQPDVEVTKLEDGDVMEFTAQVDVRPDFDLPDYSELSVEVAARKVDEDMVTEELESLRRRFATYEAVDRPAAEGDVLLVDVRATDPDGEEAEGYSATALSYELGSGGAVEGFDEAVTGASADEERTFEHIPAEGDYAGTPLNIVVTVKAVRERELPEADDDFAMLASEFDTIDELMADLREKAGRIALLQQGQEARDKVHEAFLDLIDIELPEGLITAQLEEHFTDGHGDDEHRAETEAELRKTLKSQLVLDKLAEEEELEVAEAELTQWLMSQAQRYQMAPDQFANALVEAGQVQAAIADVRRGKALSLVLEKATITDADGNTVDLDEITRLVSGQPAPEVTELTPEEALADFEEAIDEVVEAIAEADADDEAVEEAIEEAIAEVAEAVAEAEGEVVEEAEEIVQEAEVAEGAVAPEDEPKA